MAFLKLSRCSARHTSLGVKDTLAALEILWNLGALSQEPESKTKQQKRRLQQGRVQHLESLPGSRDEAQYVFLLVLPRVPVYPALLLVFGALSFILMFHTVPRPSVRSS